ncbi:CheR family methyltransferase [Phaeovibrio sulfidiphilus]|uniref:CheR family methyltransferase n=1 Tax=Phaeovibrio sulfidiphilus TaxID=1220600 RepID=UPI0018D9ABEE
MKPEDFEFIVQMLRTRSGLVLGPDKAYLLESRLMPLARKKGFKGIDDLIDQLRRRNLPLEKEVVDAMTTNESFFFRDTKPFDHFRKIVLPRLIETRAAKRSFRIWCAAASSGQEPYSLAMIIQQEAQKLAGWNIDIIGTDISSEILKKARSGQYSQFEVQRGMPADYLIRYFHKAGDAWEISPQIRSMVVFKEWNLLEELRSLGTFDVVFCRNVLLYFDQKTKGDVLERIAKVMTDDACLYLGGAETVLGITNAFKPLPRVSSVYSLTRSTVPCIGAVEAAPGTPAAGAPMAAAQAPRPTALTAGRTPATTPAPGAGSLTPRGAAPSFSARGTPGAAPGTTPTAGARAGSLPPRPAAPAPAPSPRPFSAGTGAGTTPGTPNTRPPGGVSPRPATPPPGTPSPSPRPAAAPAPAPRPTSPSPSPLSSPTQPPRKTTPPFGRS